MATGAPAAYRDHCSVRCLAELQGLITICLRADNRKPPRRAGGSLQQPGKGVQALMPAPNSLAPALTVQGITAGGCLRATNAHR
jgi:hypothetical protein